MFIFYLLCCQIKLFATFNQAKILFFGLFAINMFTFFSDAAIIYDYKNTYFNGS